MTPDKLTQLQAQKIALLSQQLPASRSKRNSLEQTLAALEHLGYVQIDTIAVINRAHHHTLWNRNLQYQESHIDQLLDERKIFEYWSHAAAYLPMRDYRFSLWRKQAIQDGTIKHWYAKDHKLMNEVLVRIKNEGPLMAKDFEGRKSSNHAWAGKPAKIALENLFMQGDLMVPKRAKFQKVYDLTERVLPSHIDTRVPTDEEYADFLITSFLRAHGFGTVAEMVYLIPKIKNAVEQVITQQLEAKKLVKLNMASQQYYALPSTLDLLSKSLRRNQVTILSPFDNLVIQRKRLSAIFNFDYSIECYLPESKRQYGYFVLPILWGGKLIARMDSKADRKSRTLYILNLVVESKLLSNESFLAALSSELARFAHFNQCQHIDIVRTSPPLLKDRLTCFLG